MICTPALLDSLHRGLRFNLVGGASLNGETLYGVWMGCDDLVQSREHRNHICLTGLLCHKLTEDFFGNSVVKQAQLGIAPENHNTKSWTAPKKPSAMEVPGPAW